MNCWEAKVHGVLEISWTRALLLWTDRIFSGRVFILAREAKVHGVLEISWTRALLLWTDRIFSGRVFILARAAQTKPWHFFTFRLEASSLRQRVHV